MLGLIGQYFRAMPQLLGTGANATLGNASMDRIHRTERKGRHRKMKQSLLALAAAAALVVGSAAYTLQAAERVSVCHNDEEEGFDHVIAERCKLPMAQHLLSDLLLSDRELAIPFTPRWLE